MTEHKKKIIHRQIHTYNFITFVGPSQLIFILATLILCLIIAGLVTYNVVIYHTVQKFNGEKV